MARGILGQMLPQQSVRLESSKTIMHINNAHNNAIPTFSSKSKRKEVRHHQVRFKGPSNRNPSTRTWKCKQRILRNPSTRTWKCKQRLQKSIIYIAIFNIDNMLQIREIWQVADSGKRENRVIMDGIKQNKGFRIHQKYGNSGITHFFINFRCMCIWSYWWAYLPLPFDFWLEPAAAASLANWFLASN